MTDPQLISEDALRGVNVAISVSESLDLARLGLTEVHCHLAVTEIARAVLLAGGNITYGGRLLPLGFTQILIDEVRRYGDGRKSLTICVPEPEHRDISTDQLKQIDKSLGTSAELVLFDSDGNETRLSAKSSTEVSASVAEALTAMRRSITQRTQARVLVGGKLKNYEGRIPGIVEEATLSIEAGRPVYVAGGYGGAAAAVAHSLGFDDHGWAPGSFPDGSDAHPVQEALRNLAAISQGASVPDGLDGSQRQQLAATHRAGDIASLVALGLSRIMQRGDSLGVS